MVPVLAAPIHPLKAKRYGLKILPIACPQRGIWVDYHLMKPIDLPSKHIGIHQGLLPVVVSLLPVLSTVWFHLHLLTTLALHQVLILIHRAYTDRLPSGMLSIDMLEKMND